MVCVTLLIIRLYISHKHWYQRYRTIKHHTHINWSIPISLNVEKIVPTLKNQKLTESPTIIQIASLFILCILISSLLIFCHFYTTSLLHCNRHRPSPSRDLLHVPTSLYKSSLVPTSLVSWFLSLFSFIFFSFHAVLVNLIHMVWFWFSFLDPVVIVENKLLNCSWNLCTLTVRSNKRNNYRRYRKEMQFILFYNHRESNRRNYRRYKSNISF